MTGPGFSEVDVDLLADYVGGALTGTPDEAAVAARLADDPAWRAAHDELVAAMVSVGAELSALGAAPEPMPAELAARLDTAFTAGRHLSAVPGDGVDRGSGERKRAMPADRRRRWRWAAPIAAAAGVIAFLGVGINYLAGRSQSGSADSTSAAAGSDQERDLTSPKMASAQAIAPAGRRIVASGRDYQQTTLAGFPPAGLKSEAAPAAEVPAAKMPPSLQRLGPTDALQACLDAIEGQNAGGTIAAQIVDYARFAGGPAVIVRFTAANGEWVWASGPDCGSPGVGAATLASVKVG